MGKQFYYLKKRVKSIFKFGTQKEQYRVDLVERRAKSPFMALGQTMICLSNVNRYDGWDFESEVELNHLSRHDFRSLGEACKSWNLFSVLQFQPISQSLSRKSGSAYFRRSSESGLH